MTATRGILVGANAKIEWLIPCFYLHLRLFSDLPITFFDFGMTAIGRRFCEKRGQIIDVDHSLWMPGKKAKLNPIKSAWFQKPLACQLAPYEENLWLDLDCQVKGSIDPIFSLLKDQWLVIREEPMNEEKHIPPSMRHLNLHYVYNSGVMAFKKNSPFIQPWIDLCQVWNQVARGDQEVLSVLLNENPQHIAYLDRIYNHFLQIDPIEKILDAQIIHFHSGFKNFLCQQYLQLESLPQKNLEKSFI